ncbi:unnamed protein product [Thlaspi arvense]|uniref:Uncharacterized protein n=1 Tax=Thlaspi arvense TaxID=13288 RepID=A0AAU9SHG6_THLAR|nr:unnamed protein product [Thlaspi arvense]
MSKRPKCSVKLPYLEITSPICQHGFSQYNTRGSCIETPLEILPPPKVTHTKLMLFDNHAVLLIRQPCLQITGLLGMRLKYQTCYLLLSLT